MYNKRIFGGKRRGNDDDLKVYYLRWKTSYGDWNPIHFHGEKNFSETICQRDYGEPEIATRHKNCDNYIVMSLAGKLEAYES